MIRLIKTELMKLKRYSVLWIGIASMLSVVLLTRFMATASDNTAYTLEHFSNAVIWNNFTLIYPAVITLIAGYIIDRERTDDTLKNLLTLPLSFRRLLVGKLFTTVLIAVFLAAIEFVFTLGVCMLSKYSDFEIIYALRALLQMIGMNLCVFIAVLPIIVFTSQRAGSYMAGVAFAFFYGFVGMFASGHGLTSIYPISAGLGLINYQGEGLSGAINLFLCLAVILLLLLLSIFMILFSHDRTVRDKQTCQKTRKLRTQAVTESSR